MRLFVLRRLCAGLRAKGPVLSGVVLRTPPSPRRASITRVLITSSGVVRPAAMAPATLPNRDCERRARCFLAWYYAACDVDWYWWGCIPWELSVPIPIHVTRGVIPRQKAPGPSLAIPRTTSLRRTGDADPRFDKRHVRQCCRCHCGWSNYSARRDQDAGYP
jgi:hypothetical protein